MHLHKWGLEDNWYADKAGHRERGTGGRPGIWAAACVCYRWENQSFMVVRTVTSSASVMI